MRRFAEPLLLCVGLLAAACPGAGFAQDGGSGGSSDGGPSTSAPSSSGPEGPGLSASEERLDGASPWYIGASVGATHDSNVFRVSGDTPRKADTIAAYTLFGGLDQQFGRQRVVANATVSGNHFRDNTDLDNTSYAGSLLLDWSTVERVAGTVNVSASQRLAQFNPGDAPSLTKKNLQNTESAAATFQLGIHTALSFTGGLRYRQLSYSAEEWNFRELNESSANAGVRYRFSGLLSAGAALRYTDTKYPEYLEVAPGVFEEDHVKRRDLDFTASWIPSGASTVDGRVSIGRSTHSEARDQDFDGLTMLVNWHWEPTGKLRVDSLLLRDTGQETTFFDAIDGPDTADNSRVSNTAQVRVGYELTGKVKMNARVRYTDRELTNTRDSGDQHGDDQTTMLSLGIDWAPTYYSTIGCHVSNQRRRAQGTISDPYKADIYGCTAQIRLQ